MIQGTCRWDRELTLLAGRNCRLRAWQPLAVLGRGPCPKLSMLQTFWARRIGQIAVGLSIPRWSRFAGRFAAGPTPCVASRRSVALGWLRAGAADAPCRALRLQQLNRRATCG